MSRRLKIILKYSQQTLFEIVIIKVNSCINCNFSPQRFVLNLVEFYIWQRLLYTYLKVVTWATSHTILDLNAICTLRHYVDQVYHHIKAHKNMYVSKEVNFAITFNSTMYCYIYASSNLQAQANHKKIYHMIAYFKFSMVHSRNLWFNPLNNRYIINEIDLFLKY